MTEPVADRLEMTRARTLSLLDLVPDIDQARQIDPLMAPLCWDLAHIGHYEELWLLRKLGGDAPTDPAFDDTYDAFAHPRAERPALDLLDPAGARAFNANIRTRVLDRLTAASSGRRDPLLTDDFVYGMVIQHEQQHIETMLATLQLMEAGFRAPLNLPSEPAHPNLPAEIELPGGDVTLGTDTEPWAYDNERPAHTVTLDPFAIDTTPVTNAAYLDFIDAGGYDEPSWWSPPGWKWRQEAGLTAPQFWYGDGTVLRFGHRVPLRPDEPVQHVCWYEADAYAHWADKRLPTESEWECAAAGATTATAHVADGPGEHWGPTAVGTRAPTATGIHDLIGNVWEWTASDFAPYPGFRAYPYDE